MPDQVVASEAMCMLRFAVNNSGRISVPLMLGSLAQLDPMIAQLLVTGYIRLLTADKVHDLPPDRLVCEVTHCGREATRMPEGLRLR